MKCELLLQKIIGKDIDKGTADEKKERIAEYFESLSGKLATCNQTWRWNRYKTWLKYSRIGSLPTRVTEFFCAWLVEVDVTG